MLIRLQEDQLCKPCSRSSSDARQEHMPSIRIVRIHCRPGSENARDCCRPVDLRHYSVYDEEFAAGQCTRAKDAKHVDVCSGFAGCSCSRCHVQVSSHPRGQTLLKRREETGRRRKKGRGLILETPLLAAALTRWRCIGPCP